MNEGTPHYGRIQIREYEQKAEKAEMESEAYGRRIEGWKDGRMEG
jgi:hypothetical protein